MTRFQRYVIQQINNIALLVYRNMGINFGSLTAAISQQSLNRTKIRTTLKQMGGKVKTPVAW